MVTTTPVTGDVEERRRIRRERLDYRLAPLLSSPSSVTRTVTRGWNESLIRALLKCKLLYLLVGRVGFEPTTNGLKVLKPCFPHRSRYFPSSRFGSALSRAA